MVGPKYYSKTEVQQDPKEAAKLIQAAKDELTSKNFKPVATELWKKLTVLETQLAMKKNMGKTLSGDDAKLYEELTKLNTTLKIRIDMGNSKGFSDFLSEKQAVFENISAPLNVTTREKKDNEFMTSTEQKTKAQQIVRNYINLVMTRGTSPSNLYGYGRNDSSPYWSSELDQKSMPKMPKDILDGIIGEELVKYKETKYYGVLKAELSGLSDERSLEIGLSALTKTQKAIDGLSMGLKSLLLGRTTSSEDIHTLLGDILSPGEIEFLAGYSKKGDITSIVQKTFSYLKGLGHEGMVSLAIESNFGEGAKLLDALLKQMGARSVPSDNLEKLEFFYSKLSIELGKGGMYAKLWKDLESKLPSAFGKLKGETQQIPPSSDPTGSITRDKYDITTVMSFLYAYEDGGSNKSYIRYLAKNSLDKETTDFLDMIMGVGNFALPTPVAATILQNYSTLDFLFKNMPNDTQGYKQVMSDVSAKVAIIYSQSFGAKFSSQYTNVKTRYEAADFFLKQVAALPDDSLLSDMVARWIASERPSIRLNNLQSLVSVIPMQEDFDVISSRLNNYVARQPDNRDLQAYYSEARNYFQSKVTGIQQQTPSDIKYNLSLINLPQTFESGVSGIFSNLMYIRENFKLDNVSGQTDTKGTDAANQNTDASGNLQFNGPNGSVNGSWNIVNNTVRDPQTGKETFKNDVDRVNISAQNFTTASINVYEFFANWAKTASLDEVQHLERVDTDTNIKLHALCPFGDLVLTADESSHPESYFKKINAYVYRGDSWYRVQTEKFENTADDFQRKIQENYVEFAQWFTPIKTQIAIEQQKLNGYKDLERTGFFMGFENTKTDTRVSSLFGKTASNNQLFVASLGMDMRTGKGSYIKPKVAAFGFVDLKNTESDIEGNQLISNPISSPQGEFKPDSRLWFGSYKVLDKFYALAIGGTDMGGVQLATKSMGFGGLAKFNHGITQFFGSGYFTSTTFDANAYLDYRDPRSYKGNGVVRVKIGKETYLNITGTAASGNVNIFNLQGEEGRQITKDFKALLDDINATTQLGWWNAPDTEEDGHYAERQNKTQQWTQTTLQLLDRVRNYVPTSFLSDLRTQFSIGIESPSFKGKLSIDRVAGPQSMNDRSKEDLYLVTMADFDGASFTAGIRVNEDMTGNKVTNFAGMKFNVSKNVVLGITGYNMFSPDKSLATTVQYQFDKGWIAQFNAKLLDNAKNFSLDLFVGNEKVKMDLQYLKQKELKNVSASILYSLGVNAPYIGGTFRYTDAGPLIIREPTITVGYTAKSGWTAKLDGGMIIATTPGGFFRDYTGKFTVSVPIR